MNLFLVICLAVCSLVGAQREADPARVLAESTFTCEGLISGYYADVNFGCRFFHQCQFFHKADGNRYVQQSTFACGEGTKFNQTTLTCDYDYNVNCNADFVNSIIQYQLTAPKPTPGPSRAKPIPTTSFTCVPQVHKNGFYFADEETNCEVYQRCLYHTVEGVVYATQYSFMCPEGTAFDQETITCVHAKDVNCANSRNLWDAQSYLHPQYELY